MEMNWSRWFRCESSFGMLLVPNQPGVFALAEEIVSPPNGRRMLAVFEIEETDDLALSLSRLFAIGSPWRDKLSEGRCFARYSVAPSLADRRAATQALKQWLESQRDLATQVFGQSAEQQPASEPRVERRVAQAEAEQAATPGEMRSERRSARAEHEGEAAERCGALENNDADDDDDEAEVKTVAERAVDRVARGGGYAKVFRTGS